MCRPFLAIAALALSAAAAEAQCTLPHPKRAPKYATTLVQAFFYCGDRGFTGDQVPNTTTEDGRPACKPPETFNMLFGTPTSGWLWDELTGQGQVQLKSSRTFPPNPLNPPDSADTSILLKLKGVVDGTGARIDGRSGFLYFIVRTTLNDRAGGNMTMIDIPLGVPFEMHEGHTTLKASIDGILNAGDQPGLPHCSSIEIIDVSVLDDNGARFADAGLFLP
jgi:hypothetical protein